MEAPLVDDVAVDKREKDALDESEEVSVDRADEDIDSQNEPVAVAIDDGKAVTLTIVAVTTAEFDRVTKFEFVEEIKDETDGDDVIVLSADAEREAPSEGEASSLIDTDTGAVAVRELTDDPVATCEFERVGVGVTEDVNCALTDEVRDPVRVGISLSDATELCEELRVGITLMDAAAERVKDRLSVGDEEDAALDDELAELAALALLHPLADGEPVLAALRLDDAV